MNKRSVSQLSAAVLFFFSTLSQAHELYLISENGDYIGQGQVMSITEATHSFTASQNFDNGISIRITGSGAASWTMDVAAPESVQLQPGSYGGAVRFPLQPTVRPGLSVSGEGRGCNKLSGEFKVLEVQYNADGSIGAFAADFEQHCEYALAALHGSIRYNSSIAVKTGIDPVIASAGDSQIRMQGQSVQLDGHYSRTTDASSIQSYRWQQRSGPAVVLSGADTEAAGFIAPNVPLGGAELTFEIAVTNNAGIVATDSVTLWISSKSDPQTFITMDSEPGDYIGQGQQHYFSVLDGSFDLSSTNADSAKLLYRGLDQWTYQFAAPSGTGLGEKYYQDATRYPFQAVSDPGLNVSGAGRGCSSLNGNFEIQTLKHDENNKLESIAANFEQYCGNSSAALRGQIRVNHIDPSVPVADAGPDQSVEGGSQVELSADNSMDADGNIADYLWSQLSGPNVELSPSNSAHPIFIAPNLAFGTTEILSFQLLVTDNLDFMAKDTVDISVVGTDLPSYCAAQGKRSSYEWIEAISIAGQENVSGNNGGYADFSDIQGMNVVIGDNSVSLTPGFNWPYREYWRIWVDLDRNGSFDSNELLLSANSVSSISSQVNIPVGTLPGPARMRVIMRYGTAANPCGSFTWGEVEDYTLHIQ